MPRVRVSRRIARYGHPPAVARAVGLETAEIVDPDTPAQVHRVRAGLAPRHGESDTAAGEDFPWRVAMSAGRYRLPTPHRLPPRRGPQRFIEHRQHRNPGRGSAPAHRPGHPLRFRGGHRRGRTCLAAQPTRGKYVTVVIDLTAVHEGTGPLRLLDLVEGLSKKALT